MRYLIRTKRFYLKTETLHYTERSGGEYRDLRQLEARIGGRVYRVSLNGQYRGAKLAKGTMLRMSNPGHAIGTSRVYLDLTHWGRYSGPLLKLAGRPYHSGPWHLSLNVGKRGVTLTTHTRAF